MAGLPHGAGPGADRNADRDFCAYGVEEDGESAERRCVKRQALNRIVTFIRSSRLEDGQRRPVAIAKAQTARRK